MELQLVELHFAQRPVCDFTAIKSRAEQILGEELGMPDRQSDDVALFFHTNHCVTYSDGKIPPQTAILSAHKPIELSGYSSDIQQSWRFRECESVLKRSRHTLLVTEMMARPLSPNDRVRLFHGVLQAVIEHSLPDALVFKHSQQVINPTDYLSASDDEPILRPGSLNVRFFNISNSDGDMMMDIRGLHEVGLHDLQCHFRNLDPNEVSRVLFNTAVYLFENGPVIESGNTIEGAEPGSKWVCQFENSLLEPTRELLDLNPGKTYAAGARH
jgi:hypothetical protein